MKISKAVLVRTGVLLSALFNQILVLAGYNTLPFTEEEMTRGLTAFFTAAVSIWTWWKNNSFTKAARKADAFKASLKEENPNTGKNLHSLS